VAFEGLQSNINVLETAR